MHTDIYVNGKAVLTIDNNMKEETNMAVLAVPMDKTFEVAVDKVKIFDKKSKEHTGKYLLQDRLKKHNKGDIEWDLKK
mgnify:FL=1